MQKRNLLIKIGTYFVVLFFITSLLMLFMYRGAGYSKIDNSYIDNNNGITYFHSYYGENDLKDLDTEFSEEEQNSLLKQFLAELNESDYRFINEVSAGFDGISCKIINRNTIDMSLLSKFVKQGNIIDDTVILDSSKSMEVPVMIGAGLNGQYQIDDIIELNIYGYTVKCLVCGILDEEASIDMMIFNDILSDSIVMPQINFVNLPVTSDEFTFQNYILSLECNGYFQYNEKVSYDEIEQYTTMLSEKYGIKWKCSKKIENEFENIQIPVNLKQCNLTIIVICIAFFLFESVFLRRNRIKVKKNTAKKKIQIQTRHVLSSLIKGVLCYELTYRILLAVNSNTPYYYELKSNRVYVVLILLASLSYKEIVQCRTIRKIMEERE